MNRRISLTVVSFLWVGTSFGFAGSLSLNLGAEEVIQSGGLDIQVPGYSVPSIVDWDDDGLNDLIVGEGSGSSSAGKIRVYLNTGTQSNPEFWDSFYVQSNGSDLVCKAAGCLGCFPRVVYWDEDDRKDLLVGQADGTVKIYLNSGTSSNPTFDEGQYVTVGYDGIAVDVGVRATPTFMDWDNDGMKDLVVGGLDGRIHIYINCGCSGGVPPAFYDSPVEGIFAEETGFDLIVPSLRSSPHIMDLDGDGKKDILTGDTNGQLLFYRNLGSDGEPDFGSYSFVTSDGIPIDLPDSPRSRPFVCDWTGDGYPDVLIGSGDGRVHLYQSIAQPGDVDKDYDVDLKDFALLLSYWLSDCGDCEGADLTGEGRVDFDDLEILIIFWLEDARI